MSTFSFRAVNRSGHTIRGQMEASNLVDLELRLRHMDLEFINGEAARNSLRLHRDHVPRRELIHFCFHLEQLACAGVPIIDALCDLRDSTSHPGFRATVASIVESIEGGLNLSNAMARHAAFDPVFCALIGAGEASGKLPEVLASLTETLKREDELAGFMQRLVIYPTLVLSVIFVAIAMAMIYVVPELSRLFLSTGQPLPLHTQLLIGLSNLIVRHGHWLLAGIAAAVLLMRIALHRHIGVRRWMDRLKLEVPLFGKLYRNILLARFASLFSMMYSSGITIVDTMKTAQNVAGNQAMSDALGRVEKLIAEGRNLTAAFTEVGLFPPLVIRMLRVGEATGALDRALANVSYFYERDVREAIARLQALMEPALTLLLGALLGWVMVSVLGPIYDIITRMNF